MDSSADNFINEKNSNFDDIFNLNSFNKEEYLLTNSNSNNKRHRKNRNSSSSSSSSSSSISKSSTSSKSRNKRSSIRSSRSTSWSSSSTSSSRSRSSSSSSSDCKTTRLKSVVILVKKSPNNNEYTSKYRYDDRENERRRFTNNHPGYVNPKVRMICTPPLPSLETTNNQQEYPYYYNNNNYYHSYPEPVPPPSVPSSVSYPYLAQYPTRNQFRPISPVKEISQINQPNSPLNQYQEVSSTINQNDACSNQNNDSKPSETIS